MPINIRPTLNRIRGIPRKFPTVNRAIETAMRPGDFLRREVADVSRKLGIPIAITSPKPQPRPVPSKQPIRKLKGHVNHGFTEDNKTFQKEGIDRFKATNGFAIANHFAIKINTPMAWTTRNLGGGNANGTAPKYGTAGGWIRDINLRAESVSLPGRNLNTTTDSNIYGPTREIVNGAGYSGDLDISFYADHELSERIFFEEWQHLCYGEPYDAEHLIKNVNDHTWNAKYYKDYIGSIEIYVLNKNDELEYGLKLWEAFPKTIGPTEMNHAANGEIVKIPVSFAYRYWTRLGHKATAVAAAPAPAPPNQLVPASAAARSRL